MSESRPLSDFFLRQSLLRLLQVQISLSPSQTSTMSHQLAQINVATMVGTDMDDPVMQYFKDNLDRINVIAESSPGFVWRLKDESDNATSFDPYDDPKVIINISVWEDVESLKNFTYKSMHKELVRRRKEWFHHPVKMHYALWWVAKGAYPTIDQAITRLDHIQKNGSSPTAFDFKEPFPQPDQF